MSSELLPIQKSNLQPVSFDIKRREPELRGVEKALLILLKSKLESNEILTREDILDFYLKEVKKGECFKTADWVYCPIKKHYVSYNERVVSWRTRYNIKSQALSYFQRTLGAVIVKGKLLVIPPIEI